MSITDVTASLTVADLIELDRDDVNTLIAVLHIMDTPRLERLSRKLAEAVPAFKGLNGFDSQRTDLNVLASRVNRELRLRNAKATYARLVAEAV